MTTTADMNAADYLKYLVEETGHLLDAATDSLANVEQHSDADQFDQKIDDVCDLIQSAQREIIEAAAAFSADGGDMATYSDGRPVTTSCDIEENGATFRYSLHPSPFHPYNRPRDLCTVDCRDGARKRIVLQAGPTIVAVPVEPLRAVKAGEV